MVPTWGSARGVTTGVEASLPRIASSLGKNLPTHVKQPCSSYITDQLNLFSRADCDATHAIATSLAGVGEGAECQRAASCSFPGWPRWRQGHGRTRRRCHKGMQQPLVDEVEETNDNELEQEADRE
jgi:hypothetical protein